MDLRQLESLLAVLDSPTMTRAAEGLHLSTAAVSIQLQSLAPELGVELFVRSGRKLKATPAAHLGVIGPYRLVRELGRRDICKCELSD